MEKAVRRPGNKQESKPTILIVEDHFITRWSAAELLRRKGYKVLEAVNVTDALGLATAGATIDAVFSDVQLGEEHEGGHDLARWFGKHRPAMPVLLTSGVVEHGQVPMGNLRAFVQKPYDMTLVEQILRSMIEQR